MSRDGFLSRWSRRKAEARERDREEDGGAPLEEAPDENLPAAAPSDDGPVPEPAPEEEEEPLDLPDIDSLTADSDYTAFLKDKVPAALRKQALRKLWRSDPVLANLDGLNDYDDDYGAPIVTGAAVRTAYNVLRGYARPDEDEDAVQKAEAGPIASGTNVARDGERPDVDVALQQDDDLASSGGETSNETAVQQTGSENPGKA